MAPLPNELEGKTVLDIGTSNGGVAFLMERRGAARVVAVDIYPVEWFGFAAIRDFLGSKVEYYQASVYELPTVLNEQFDLVFFWGVLYHLRHPLLALDAVRQLTKTTALLESAIADWELGELKDLPLVRFYRRGELGGDTSNWFAPTIGALVDWCWSSGFIPELISAWPETTPARCMIKLDSADEVPEFQTISYERPLVVQAPRL